MYSLQEFVNHFTSQLKGEIPFAASDIFLYLAIILGFIIFCLIFVGFLLGITRQEQLPMASSWENPIPSSSKKESEFSLPSLPSSSEKPRLVIRRKTNSGKSVECGITYASLKKFPHGIIIGRSKNSSVRLLEKNVSRHHARLSASGGHFIIEDLQSGNGTFLDGKKLAPGKPTPIFNGNELALGSVHLTLHILS